MYPTFELGPLDFPAYFTFLTIGYLLAVLLGWKESFRLKGIDPNKLLDLAIVLLLAGLVGARLLHVVADGYWDDYVNLCLDPFLVKGKVLPHKLKCISDQMCIDADKGELCNVATGICHQGRDCLRAFKIWYGGLAFYGGLLLAMAAGIWYVRRHRDRLPIWRVGDLAGFGIPLGLVFGRVGCLLAGCCFGGVTDGTWGIHFPHGSPAWEKHVEDHLITKAAGESLAVVPTQLIQIGTNLLMFLICYALFRRWRKFDGMIFWVFMILYAVFRFIVEYWRDDYRGVWFGGTMSTSQLIAIPAVAVAIFMLWYLRRKGAQAAGQPAPGDA